MARNSIGFKKIPNNGTPRACVTRAIATSLNMRFKKVHKDLETLCAFYYTKGLPKKFSPDTGLPRKAVDVYLIAAGYEWVPCIRPGVKKRTRLSQLPKRGNLIACCYRHMVAVKNGNVYDITDWAVKRNLCVVGYYVKR